jgi:hypothetical protein
LPRLIIREGISPAYHPCRQAERRRIIPQQWFAPVYLC